MDCIHKFTRYGKKEICDTCGMKRNPKSTIRKVLHIFIIIISFIIIMIFTIYMINYYNHQISDDTSINIPKNVYIDDLKVNNIIDNIVNNILDTTIDNTIDKDINETQKITNNITPKPPEIIHTPDENYITYYLSTSIPVDDHSIPISATYIAFEKWNELNPQLKFKQSQSVDADILILWDKYVHVEHQGVARCDFINKCEISISLGSRDCNDVYIQRSENGVANTIMHEVGHVIGLGHSKDSNHLMYGMKKPIPDSVFNSMSYVIPNKFEGSSYVGQQKINDQINQLNALIKEYNSKSSVIKQELDVVQTKALNLISERDGILSRYGVDITNQDSTITVEPEVYDKISPINSDIDVLIIQEKTTIQQYNEIINESNNIVNELNLLVNKANCYPNIR